MTLSPQPLQRAKSLHEQAYQALRTGILSGELAPGDRLVETQLAQWLQVSRTPLREALRQLQREGLVTAEPNGGLRVSTISAEDAIHLYDCRLALEQLAVAEACKNITKTQLKKLEKYVNQAESLERSTTQPALIQLLDLDYQFHHLIAESSANKRLISLLENVFDAMSLLRIQTLRRNPEVLNIRLEHRQIYEAIAQHDSATAVEAIVTHLTASKARVVQEIQRQN
ncbi:GntR family transcriptional regulator [Oscillatoria sp. FACHB-1407]|uniref:GntR family transcriptional regulator n=1 Tax=Oscillatoria sp. FACHB-1407 TaxID=2692847 RepID=UPI0016857E85|nr:GntR family transcriptional regulator [Oscillatoria sp. FACHB-1407]MBD2460562.1 GntR family transcriptional regulator [Oscillatoria sp. FACHB-1407]